MGKRKGKVLAEDEFFGGMAENVAHEVYGAPKAVIAPRRAEWEPCVVCDRQIKPGDKVVRWPDGWAHEGC